MRAGTPASTGPRPIEVPRDRLESWKEIASYLRRDVRTVQRWEQERGLPVHRIPGAAKGAGVYAIRVEIDAWWERRRDNEAPSLPPSKLRLAWVIAAAVLLLCIGAAWFWSRRGGALPEVSSYALTHLPGSAVWPAFSPDGREIAFTWNGEKANFWNIYLLRIGSDEPRRLTWGTAADSNAAFSPDGLWLAFIRRPVIQGTRMDALFVMPALGGRARMIASVWVPGMTRALAWSPDGRWLIVAAGPAENEPYALMAYPVDGGEPRQLTVPRAEPGVADTSPVVSPDGLSIAFLRSHTWGVRCCSDIADGDAFVLSISGDLKPRGEPVRVSAEKCCVTDVAWTENGDILYVVRGETTRRVMRTSPSGLTPPRLLPSLRPVGLDLAASPHGDRLVYSTVPRSSIIWRVELSGPRPEPDLMIWSSLGDLDPRFSPDGKKFVFVSARSGRWSLWLADADTTNQMELVSLPGGVADPRWSPDGSEIAFDGRDGDGSDIWVVSAEGGKPRRVTTDPANDINPAWSHDGKWIYFSSTRTGKEQLFRTPSHPVNGAAEAATQITRNGGHIAWESADGKDLYFVKAMWYANLYRMPATGGEETTLPLRVKSSHGFEVTADGIWLQKVPEGIGFGFDVAFYRFATGKVEVAASVPKPIAVGFTVSPIPGPHRRVLYSSGQLLPGDLWLVENFR